MTARRSPIIAVAACALGALAILLASGRRWASTTLGGVAGGHTALSVTGHQVAPSLPALAFALLALAAAILAARGVLRRVVGVVIVFVAAAVVGVAVSAPGDVSSALKHRELGAQGLVVHASANGWWVLATVGGLLGVVAGVLTVFFSDQWAGMGARYDAPTAPRPAKDPGAVAWDALDRGEDPTV